MNAYASQTLGSYADDVFDVDMDFSETAPQPQASPLSFSTPPQPQTPPSAGAPQGGHQRVEAVTGYNPAGELAPQAQTGLTPVGGIAEVSVPRIAIHVFAERQDTLNAAERAAQDRRMSRATTQIRVGGVMAAVETYQHEPTPPLIIVECLRDPQGLLQEVDQLAEVCDAGTKVVVIGSTNDIILFRELMRRGVSEYLVAPLQPLQLISAIGGLFNDPAQPFVGRTIAFVGARGGAGASAVAHNTAYAISERIGANTVMVDYDLPFGTAGLDFNQDPLNGVADALGQPDRLDATLLDRQAEPVCGPRHAGR
jgi:pilus assembly protein CpaE